ncbi:MAG: cysteine desulfurase, partial [Propionibacteriales bacterium]
MRVYLDHAATAPLTEPARAAMIEAYAVLGNPAAAHGSGRQARAVLDDAREVVATCVGADPERVVFTSGGTEADNLAVFGGWQAYGKPGRLLLTSTIEHQAVLDSAKAVANQGGEVRFLPVNAEGEVTGFDGLDRAALISVMRVNNET